MKKIIVIAVALFWMSNMAKSQEVVVMEFDSMNTTLDKVKGFHCMYEKSDSIYGKSFGKLKGVCANSKKSQLDNLFNKLKKQSNKLKCNAFSVDSSYFTSQDSLVVFNSIYRLTEKEIEINYDRYPRNMIYVFGEIRKDKKKGKKFKLNGKKAKLQPLEYVALQNEIGKETSISVGGFLGSKIWVKGKEDRLPTYLSFTGFNVSSGNNNFNNQTGVQFNTGKINYVGIDFGEFLAKVLKPKTQEEIIGRK